MIHLETGKYAFFIWTAYGVTAAVFLAMIASSLAHARRWKARAEALGRK
ncbi:MAG: heme exporter protein CcmD [Caulobacterales bacterium]|jgi:heme exporter protein D